MVHGAWCMVHGAWRMVHGAWRMVHGAWRMAHGAWCVVHGAWCVVHGAWRMAHGAWCVVRGAWAAFGRDGAVFIEIFTVCLRPPPRWCPKDEEAGPVRVLPSANKLFLKIRTSLNRCSRMISKGQTLLSVTQIFYVGRVFSVTSSHKSMFHRMKLPNILCIRCLFG